MFEMPLVGYQEWVEWLGEETLTLADVWPEAARTAIVGLNPAPKSVAAGHYYQGQVGSRQMARLSDAGLFERPRGTYIEEVALAAGVGFTDIVKRPTPREGGITRREIDFGRNRLVEDLSARGIELVVCVFRQPAEALTGRRDRPGFQTIPTPWGAEVFRMPGPFEPVEVVDAVMRDLKTYLAEHSD